MKVAFVVTGGLHPSGRDEIVPLWVSLIERLARVHEVHAFALHHLDRPTDYTLAGAAVHDLGRPSGWQRWARLRRKLLDDGPFDAIHGLWGHPPGSLAALAGRTLGIPAVVTCDSGEFVSVAEIDYGLQRRWRSRTMVRLACQLATRVHVATHYMQDLAATLGVSATRIPLGVDIARFRPRKAPPEGPPWRVLQVASLNRVKDQTTLLVAMAALRRDLDVRLDLVGQDTLNGELQSTATRLGIADAVSFHGVQPNDALGRFHEQAHLYVQSSQHEAAGVAVLEAASCGVPIVGTRVGYVCDWGPQDGAFAVPPGDPVSLAAAIRHAVRYRPERELVAANGQRFARAHDADWSSRALTALYEEVRSSSRRG